MAPRSRPISKLHARLHDWRRAAYVALFIVVPAIVFVACGSNGDQSHTFIPVDGSTSSGNDGSTGPIGDDSATGDDVASFGDVDQGDDGGAFADAFVIPENFVPTEHGGYALGPPLTGSGSDAGLVQNGGTANCSLVLGVVRDIKSFGVDPGATNGDFETFNGSGATPGLVKAAIGTDRKPVYNNECDNAGQPNPPCLYGKQMTTQSDFDQWYRFVDGVNLPYIVYMQFVPTSGNTYTFESSNFFPLDNAGFGNTTGMAHNFSFTTELHLKFTYGGGEVFTFSGDDDLWVFINGKLAIDLGGLHSPVSATVNLDTLGLTKGTQYDIELFNAERHSTGSNFRVDTNLAFTNCGTVPPDKPK